MSLRDEAIQAMREGWNDSPTWRAASHAYGCCEMRFGKDEDMDKALDGLLAWLRENELRLWAQINSANQSDFATTVSLPALRRALSEQDDA